MAKLTAKQQAFVACYNGNGVEAARAAGYSGNDATLAQVAHENLRKPEIVAAIKERQGARENKLIATREQRQAFWTAVLNDQMVEMKDRLRASELLGKSEADFTEKIEVTAKLTLEQLVEQAAKKL